MIDKIKNELYSIKGKRINIKINNIRNKEENIICVVKELYNRVFIVETLDGISRSFNYSDVLTGNVELEYKKYWLFAN